MAVSKSTFVCKSVPLFVVCCHVPCEVCQQFPADGMIIQPVLQELRESLKRCLTPEAKKLYTVRRQLENLQALSATVESLEQAKTIPVLGFEGILFIIPV